jgi:hypothetical protein
MAMTLTVGYESHLGGTTPSGTHAEAGAARLVRFNGSLVHFVQV